MSFDPLFWRAPEHKEVTSSWTPAPDAARSKAPAAAPQGVQGFIVALPTEWTRREDNTGRVVGIADGDTVTLLDAANNQHKIRLSGIDSPEKTMPWGQKAKEGLSEMAFGQAVLIDWSKRDRYQRIVGIVLLNGQDINLALIRKGLAWHYKKYANEQSASDRAAYSSEEIDARAARRGLWSDPKPVPPWEWRKARRTGNPS